MPQKVMVMDGEPALRAADALADANDSSEMAGLDGQAPDRLALPGLTRADLTRVHEMTAVVGCERFHSVAA